MRKRPVRIASAFVNRATGAALAGWCAVIALHHVPAAAQTQPGKARPTTSLIERGKYLAQAGDCIACHTIPGKKIFSGNRALPTPFGTLYSPNITPDRETGIGGWTEDQIADYLETGNRPDGDVAGGLMMEVIQGSSAGYKDLTKADRLAIAKYLKSIPAVKNKID